MKSPSCVCPAVVVTHCHGREVLVEVAERPLGQVRWFGRPGFECRRS